jgi:GT2 family glycosyltransferase
VCEGPYFDITAVIVAGATDPVEDCLAALAKEVANAETRSGIRTRICVVGNGMTGHLADWIAEHHPEVAWRHTKRPLGYAAAHNLGLAIATREETRYFLLLSPRALVLPGLISGLVDAMGRRCDLGLAAPLQHAYTPGDLTLGEHNGRSAALLEQAVARTGREAPAAPEGGCCRNGGTPGFIEGSILDGSALFGRTEVLHRTGALDERYQTGFALEDLVHRARLDGWRTGVLTGLGIQLRAKGSEVARDYMRDYRDYRDCLYFMACNPNRARLDPATRMLFLALTARLFLGTLWRRPGVVCAMGVRVAAAHGWLARHRLRAMRRRREAHRLQRNPTWNREPTETAPAERTQT